MCISSNFKARTGVIFTLTLSIQGILGCFLCRDFPPHPAFLCVLCCSSTRSLQLSTHLCKSRTLRPREWGTQPLTGTVNSLWALQRKEREQKFAFISSVEQEPPAQLSLFPFTMDKSSSTSIYCFRTNTMIRKLPDVGAQSHFSFTISHYWPLLKLLLVVKYWT